MSGCRGGVPILFRALCEKSLPCFAEAPSEAEGGAEGVGFHGRRAHWLFRASRPAFFHHIFLSPKTLTPNRHRAIIPRQCSIENCARLQRRTHHPPQNHLRRLFDKQTKSSRQVDNKQLKAATPHPEKCTPNRRDPS